MPRTEDELIKWLDSEHRDPNSFMFGIRLLERDTTLIGYCGISGILWTHDTGWLEIGIGDKARRGKGYGTEAMRLLTVFSYNAAAIALYQKLGFTHKGTHRDGQRYDMLNYGLLRHEWESR
jgi:RimJ/RimL family protein N-acetyltransferase